MIHEVKFNLKNDSCVQLCDVISKWETALREKGLGKFQNTKVIRLTYRHRLFWRNTLKGETERERLLHCYQTAQRITDNRFPLTRCANSNRKSIYAYCRCDGLFDN